MEVLILIRGRDPYRCKFPLGSMHILLVSVSSKPLQASSYIREESELESESRLLFVYLVVNVMALRFRSQGALSDGDAKNWVEYPSLAMTASAKRSV